MLLRHLQNLLGGIYGIDVPEDVNDFLVTDQAVVEYLAGMNSGHDIDEKLLIVQNQDSLDVALYLDKEVLVRLSSADPRHHLHRQNLGDFWTVLEGVSHFNYLAWNASLDKPVTLMELEMQAEVDKYIGTRLMLQEQTGEVPARRIIEQLFEETYFYAHLSEQELERYRSASSFASRYCYSLENRFPRDRVASDMMQELRAFYRLPQPGKVSHIQSAQLA